MVLDRMAYDKDPWAFCAAQDAEEEELTERLTKATKALPKVKIPGDVRLKIR